jgi:hypothetical protein
VARQVEAGEGKIEAAGGKVQQVLPEVERVHAPRLVAAPLPVARRVEVVPALRAGQRLRPCARQTLSQSVTAQSRHAQAS